MGTLGLAEVNDILNVLNMKNSSLLQKPYWTTKDHLKHTFYDAFEFFDKIEKLENYGIYIVADHAIRLFNENRFLAYFMFYDDEIVVRGKPNGTLRKGTIDFSINFFRYFTDELIRFDKKQVEEEKLSKSKWTSISIRNNKRAKKYFDALYHCITNFSEEVNSSTHKDHDSINLNSAEIEDKIYREGSASTTLLTIYERNNNARQTCLKHWGYSCAVCGFNFEKAYGEYGKKYIHVHHTTPISTIKHEYEINPITDLKPICPNCHSMIHKTFIPLTIEELKQKMNRI